MNQLSQPCTVIGDPHQIVSWSAWEWELPCWSMLNLPDDFLFLQCHFSAVSSCLEESMHQIIAEKGDLCYTRKLHYRFSWRLYTLDTSCDSAEPKQDVHPACPLTSQSLHNLSLTLSLAHTPVHLPPSQPLWTPLSDCRSAPKGSEVLLLDLCD